MKKILFILILILPYPVLASTISARGYGDTIQLARHDAYEQLATQIEINISVDTETQIESYAENDIINNYNYSSKQISNIDFIGIEYKEITNSNNQYCIEAFINEDKSDLYVIEIDKLADNINSLITLKNSNENKIFYLEKILNSYYLYENYLKILTRLDSAKNYKRTKQNITILKVEYESELKKKDDELKNQEFILKNRLTIAQQKENELLQNIIEERNKNQEQLDLIKARERAWRDSIYNSKSKEIQAEASKLVKEADLFLDVFKNKSDKSEYEPDSIIHSLEEQITIYNDYYKKVCSELNQLRRSKEAEYEEKSFEIKNRKLHAAELSNGVETSEIKAMTKRRIEKVELQISDEYISQRKNILDNVNTLGNKYYEEIQNNFDILENTFFCVDYNNENTNITIGKYDGQKNGWPVVIETIFLSKPLCFEFFMPYSKYSGEKDIPSIGDGVDYSKEFQEYLYKIDLLEAYFAKEDSHPLSVNIGYKIKTNRDNFKTFNYNISKIIVTRNDTGDKIIHAQFDKPIELLNIDNSHSFEIYKVNEILKIGEFEYCINNTNFNEKFNIYPYSVKIINENDSDIILSADEDNNLKLPDKVFTNSRNLEINAYTSNELDVNEYYSLGSTIKLTRPLVLNRVFASPIKDFIIDNHMIIKYQGQDQSVILPFFSKEKNLITSINKGCFDSNSNMIYISFNLNIDKIEERIIYKCENLRYLDLGKLTQIKSLNPDFIGFNSKQKIERFILPESIEIIADGQFKDYQKLNKITLQEGLNSIGNYAFSKTKIKELIIPNSVVEIKDSAFVNMENLEYLVYPKNIKIDLKPSNFSDTKNIKTIIFPENLKEITDRTFENFDKLEKVVLPKSLTKIGKKAFKNTNLKKMEFPKTLILIENSAFEDCKNLEDIKFHNYNLEIGMEAFKNTGLKDVILSSETSFVLNKLLKNLNTFDKEVNLILK